MACSRSFETRGYPTDLGRYEMAFVEKVTPAMFDDVFPLLSELDSAYSREKWREIFDYGGSRMKGI